VDACGFLGLCGLVIVFATLSGKGKYGLAATLSGM